MILLTLVITSAQVVETSVTTTDKKILLKITLTRTITSHYHKVYAICEVS